MALGFNFAGGGQVKARNFMQHGAFKNMDRSENLFLNGWRGERARRAIDDRALGIISFNPSVSY
jgi:hypothetical protein